METINDIVREVAEEMMNTSMQDITAKVIHGWATRLGDAAGKQSVTDCNQKEQAVVRENRTSQESRQVGNAAAMREALSDACYAMFNFLKTQNGDYEEMANALDKAKAALAAPPRNCDRFKTKEEAALAYAGECNAFIPQSILWQIGEWLDWLFDEAKGEAK